MLAKDIYEKYVSADGHITIPSDENERRLLGRALLGAEFISRFDYWLDHAIASIF